MFFNICVIHVLLLLNCECKSDNQITQNQYMELFSANIDLSLRNSLVLPDLSEISNACSKKEFFVTTNPVHAKAVLAVQRLLSGTNSSTEFIILAKALRNSQHINPKVWFHAITTYLYNSNHSYYTIQKISPWEAMPDNFINSDALQTAKDFWGGKKKCVVVDEKFGEDNGIDNELWYFRQDIMINSHHWYWHIYNPLIPSVKSDRVGELFYYFHEQLVARYNAERFCNGQPRARAFDLHVGAIIAEGYNAHLRDDNSGYNWTDRPPNTPLSDVSQSTDRTNTYIDIDDMMTIRNRIYRAIENGFVVARNGDEVPILNFGGIDILGNIVEAMNSNINPESYGSNGLHNNGHMVLSLAVDPLYRLKLPPGVMGDFSVAIRDPIFFRWHTFISDIFDKHKKKLPSYLPAEGDFPLLYKGVTLKSIQVTSTTLDKKSTINKLHTFWRMKNINFVHGLDFTRNVSRGPVNLCIKHLDHMEFNYKFIIEKTNVTTTTLGTARVFLSPRYQENGERFHLEEQRRFFFQLDLFSVILNSSKTVIDRSSIKSTLTIPWEESCNQLQMTNNTKTPNCGCGWPQHMLLPKGNESGMTFDLFVMVTNGDVDLVVQTQPPQGDCHEASLQCGLIHQKYPDARPMGYPLDRIVYSGSDSTLAEFMSGIPNMNSIQVQIYHTNKIIQPGILTL